MKGCGACCYLDPTERPDLDQYLEPEQLELYISLIGPDGWCKNYDVEQRNCKIYNDRPIFCRVEPTNFETMYHIDPEHFQEFAIDCCLEHIGDLYGEDSAEYERYEELTTGDG
jgi:Fe-S-cluster containining protein